MSIISTAIGLMEFAPMIAKLVSGDSAKDIAQEIVGKAKKLAGSDKLDSIKEAFRNNPKILAQFQKDMYLMRVRLDQGYLEDRQNARARDLEFIRLRRRNFRADTMVLCAALGLVSCLLSLSFFQATLPGEAVGIISTVAGIFGSCLKDAYSFEFGSSRGSKEKDTQQLWSHLKAEEEFI